MQYSRVDFLDEVWSDIQADTAVLREASGAILGCRFLYSARETFTRNTGLLIAGINPGGQVDMSDRPYPDDGVNSYLSEDWTGSPYRARMEWFMRGLYERFGVENTEAAINATLTANLLPFRTPRSGDLKGDVRRRAFSFSIDMWKRVLPVTGVRAVVCAGNVAWDGFWKICHDLGMPAPIGIPHAAGSNWGIWCLDRAFEQLKELGFAPSDAKGISQDS